MFNVFQETSSLEIAGGGGGQRPLLTSYAGELDRFIVYMMIGCVIV